MTEQPTPSPAMEPPEQPPTFRSGLPTGWIVTLILYLTLLYIAVSQYFGPTNKEKGYSELQNELRYQVSINSSDMQKLVGDSTKAGLEDILDKATKGASTSDEAARIAVATAREVRAEIPRTAIARLSASKEPINRDIVALIEDSAQRGALDRLSGAADADYATKLFVAQEKESLGDKSARADVADKNMFVRMMLFVLLFLGMFVVGLICLVLFLDARRKGRLVPVGFAGLSVEDGDRRIARFAMYIVAFGVVPFAFMGLDDEIGEAWTMTIASTAVLIVVVALLAIRVGGTSDTLRATTGPATPWGRQLFLGVFGYLATIPLLAVSIAFMAFLTKYFPTPTHPITEEVAKATGSEWIALFLSAAVIAPVLEEITFRSLLLPALATRIKRPLWAMVVCAFVFASIHPQGPLIWPALGSIGLTAAYLRYYTGSTLPSIVVHMLNNGIVMALTFVLL